MSWEVRFTNSTMFIQVFSCMVKPMRFNVFSLSDWKLKLGEVCVENGQLPLVQTRRLVTRYMLAEVRRSHTPEPIDQSQDPHFCDLRGGFTGVPRRSLGAGTPNFGAGIPTSLLQTTISQEHRSPQSLSL